MLCITKVTESERSQIYRGGKLVGIWSVKWHDDTLYVVEDNYVKANSFYPPYRMWPVSDRERHEELLYLTDGALGLFYKDGEVEIEFPKAEHDTYLADLVTARVHHIMRRFPHKASEEGTWPAEVVRSIRIGSQTWPLDKISGYGTYAHLPFGIACAVHALSEVKYFVDEEEVVVTDQQSS